MAVEIFALRGPFDDPPQRGVSFYIADTFGDLPDPGPEDDDFGFAKDSKLWYVFDGGWVEVVPGTVDPGSLDHGGLSGLGGDDHPQYHNDARGDARYATPADVAAAIAGLIGSAPATLDTLGELSDALGDDPSFAAAVATALGGKSAVGHGDGDHTDTTEAIFIPVGGGLQADGAGAGTIGAAPNGVSSLTLANGVSTGVFCFFRMPEDAKAASPISVVIHWASVIAENGTSVRWAVRCDDYVAGEDLSGALSAANFTGTAANKTANLLIQEAVTQILASTDPGKLVKLNIRRVGADALDTFTGVAHIVGLEVRYTRTH